MRWQRGDYVFETCLHWLLGSNPDGALHEEWREICDVDSLTFLEHEEFIRVESEDGKALHVFADIDWLEAELLTVAPEDADEIGNFTTAIRHLMDVPVPDPSAGCQKRASRIAEAVVAILERRMPGIATAIEVTDVSTPATVIWLTGNWQGSMEGWLMTPETGFGGLAITLPGLDRFVRAGQWVQPGGGLPGGLMTGRAAVQAMCRVDRRVFSA